MTQIGSVEIKRLRVYPENPDDPAGSRDVTVQPGIFPLMRSGERIWWPMRGRVSERRDADCERIGEGMFALTLAHDDVSDEQVSIVSRTFTRAQLDDLMREPGMRDEDGPEQRLRFVLFEPAPSGAGDQDANGGDAS